MKFLPAFRTLLGFHSRFWGFLIVAGALQGERGFHGIAELFQGFQKDSQQVKEAFQVVSGQFWIISGVIQWILLGFQVV